MKMYVGNCTKQAHDFIYRTPDDKRAKKQRIGVLEQVVLSIDLDPIAFKSIVEQHEMYGFVDAAKLDQSKVFTGLCYSDKPIKIPRLAQAIEANDAVLVKRGEEIRKQAAVAVSNQIQNATGGRLNQLEVSVQEETEDGGAPRVSEGIRVVRGGEGPSDTQPRKRRGGGRKAASA